MFIKACLILLIVMFSFVPSAQADKKFTFLQTELGPKYHCAINALNRAYANLGIEVEYLVQPNRRAIDSSNRGKFDGEMLRVDGVEHLFPNLIKIPVPLCAIKSVMLAGNHVSATTIEELKTYHFGIILGFIDQERYVKQHNITATKLVKYDRLFDMLELGRVDVIFLPLTQAHQWLTDEKKKHFKFLKNFNRDLYLYHYLHKKHKHLLSDVTQQLRVLEQNGQIELFNIKN
ncbi:hypothetical protein DS2_10732 [Catenovulum agarivorans DS-2]|uniref:Uncharacterized protein n=1 Tax=Catenovulum agarivorans DS-2 TaxID=1328313 RepID=W7QDC6_9ALTE|nr:transporter substrate-binding domain-containing protein [Catenovulum agarivorans]EWH09916.1 hypothetical protein DS2_10732 [Catenovulum agarivorans DS-2]